MQKMKSNVSGNELSPEQQQTLQPQKTVRFGFVRFYSLLFGFIRFLWEAAENRTGRRWGDEGNCLLNSSVLRLGQARSQ
jgi:hypothetical protein